MFDLEQVLITMILQEQKNKDFYQARSNSKDNKSDNKDF